MVGVLTGSVHAARTRSAAAGSKINQAGVLRSSRVESIRALAALSVLAGHVAVHSFGITVFQGWHRYVQAGGFGVFVFFSLSGYLLFRPFVRSMWGDGASIRLGRYAANRALRILPLYYITAAFFIVVRDHASEFDVWWRFALILPNYHLHSVQAVDGGMWSIVVEVEFYILLPLLVWVLGKLARGSFARAAGLLALVGIAAYLVHLLTVTRVTGVNPDWRYSLPTTFVFFVPGMLLAMWVTYLDGVRPGWLRGPAARSDVWMLGAALCFVLVAGHYDWDGLVLIGCFLLVGGAVLPLVSGVGNRMLDWRPLAALGVASYSLYLWHGPTVRWLGHHVDGFPALLAVSLLVCIPIAIVSYKVIETPFLRLRKRWQGTDRGTTEEFVATADDVAVLAGTGVGS